MRCLVTGFFVIQAISCAAQVGYHIQMNVSGLKDTTAQLGCFIDESELIRDSAIVSEEGSLEFSGPDPLPQGIYMLVVNQTKQFEFVVGSDQHFTLSTDIREPVQHMKVDGDRDNTLFFKNLLFNMALNREAEPYLRIVRDTTQKEHTAEVARKQLSHISERALAFQLDLVESDSLTLTARIMKAHLPIDIPEPPLRPNGLIDSTFQLRWYRKHFFDHFDLSDDALLRLSRPVYRDRIYEYLDELYPPDPNTLTKATHYIINRAKNNPETYKYAVLLCMLKYQDHDIASLREVYVNLFDSYVASGKMDFWATEDIKQNMKDHAERLRKGLIENTAHVKGSVVRP